MLNTCKGFRGAFHQEICYAGTQCPACQLVQEVGEKADKIESLEADLDMERRGRKERPAAYRMTPEVRA